MNDVNSLLKELKGVGLVKEASEIKKVLSEVFVDTEKVVTYSVYRNGDTNAALMNTIWSSYSKKEAELIITFLNKRPYAKGDEKEDLDTHLKIRESYTFASKKYLIELKKKYPDIKIIKQKKQDLILKDF